MMKLEHLRYFMSVANTQSINQAAGKLYISQQQLNNILTGLEDEMQVSLFKRTNKGISLTEDGIIFAEYAKKLLTIYAEMQAYFLMRHSADGMNHAVEQGKCILHTPPFISIFLSDFINQFKTISPNIDLLCIESTEQIYAEQLKSEHLYLTGLPIAKQLSQTPESLVNVIPIIEFETYIYLNRHSLLAQQKSISRQVYMDYINAVMPLSLPNSYKAENIVLISSNIYQQLESIVRNETVCLLPGFLFTKMSSLYPDVTVRPLDEPIYSSCNIVYANTYTLSSADEILIAFLKTYLQNLQLFSRQTFHQNLSR